MVEGATEHGTMVDGCVVTPMIENEDDMVEGVETRLATKYNGVATPYDGTVGMPRNAVVEGDRMIEMEIGCDVYGMMETRDQMVEEAAVMEAKNEHEDDRMDGAMVKYEEHDNGGNENDEMVEGLKKTKQGTLRHFFSKPITFRARPNGENGGGSSQGGVDGLVDKTRWREPDVTNCNDSMKGVGVKKIKAQAKMKRKRGAKSGTGKKTRSKGSNCSQKSICNYLICEKRPVEVEDSLGRKTY